MTLRYDTRIGTGTSQDIVLSFIERGDCILDVGCATGYLGEAIRKKRPDATLWAIEIDEESRAIARKKGIYRDIFQLDLNTDFVVGNLPPKSCDYIILADVLEHLTSPETTLERLKTYLKDDGEFLISLPNINYFEIAAKHLSHQLAYTNIGLLDYTHLRFFAADSIAELVTKTRLSFTRMCPTRQSMAAIDYLCWRFDIPSDIAAFILMRNPESMIFQYVFSAKKSDAESDADVLSHNLEAIRSSWLPDSSGGAYGRMTSGRLEYRGANEEFSDGKFLLRFFSEAEGVFSANFPLTALQAEDQFFRLSLTALRKEEWEICDLSWLDCAGHGIEPVENCRIGDRWFNFADEKHPVVSSQGLVCLFDGRPSGAHFLSVRYRRLGSQEDESLLALQKHLDEFGQKLASSLAALAPGLDQLNAMQRAEADEALRHVETLRLSLSHQHGEIESVYRRFHDSLDYYQDIEQRYEAMATSFFWRMTAWARKLTDQLKGDCRLCGTLIRLMHRVRNAIGTRKAHILADHLFHRIPANRRRLKEYRGAILFIDHNFGGGANKYRDMRIARLLREGKKCILLHNHLHGKEHQYYQLHFHAPGEPEWILSFDHLKQVFKCLDLCAPSCVVYNSLVHYPHLGRMLEYLAKTPAPEMEILLHDFFVLCPAYNLIGDDGAFCKLNRDCGQCRQIGEQEHMRGQEWSIAQWRAGWRKVLKRASHVTAFSASSKEYFLRVYPEFADKVRVMPHEMDYPMPQNVRLEAWDKMVLGVIGCIGSIPKGSRMTHRLAEAMAPDTLFVVGDYDGKPCDNLTILGHFDEKTLPEMLRSNKINILLIPSICPETFSYLTSELIACNLPVIVFDLGAQAEKVRAYAHGRVIPEMTPESVLDSARNLYDEYYSKEQN